jgi:hypothetical protein
MGAAEVGLMSRMPGVHGLAGQQAIAALTKDIADQRQDIRGQIPGAISDTVSQLRNQAIDLALANRARRDDRRAAAADASAGGFDQGQMIGYRGDAISAIQSLGDSLYTERPIVIERKGGKAIYAKEGGGRTFNPNEAAVQQSALPYSEAYQRAYALVAGQLRAAGFSEPEIASTVQEALAAMGFSGGGRGGDYTSFALTPGLQSMSRVEEIRAGR